ENIWLGRFPMTGFWPLKFVNEKQMAEDTLRLFRELDIDIDPRARTGALSVSKIQSLEIVKAVSYHSKVIVMDEPTSSLTGNEVEHLFSIMNRLRSQGVSIVYISHKMEEILRISDDVTIMR
ncbi:sugar ABC transporter ATP-binding protein, partial [Clostridium perfringens]